MRDILRRVLSRLANLTPNTFYYSSELEVHLRDESGAWLRETTDATGEGGIRPLPMTLMSVAAAAYDDLGPGASLVVEFDGLEHGGRSIGSYRILVERIT